MRVGGEPADGRRQTARYRVDNPPADSYKRARGPFCPLAAQFQASELASQPADRCTFGAAGIAELNDPNFAERAQP